MYVDRHGRLLRGEEAYSTRMEDLRSRRPRFFNQGSDIILSLVVVVGLMTALNPSRDSFRSYLDQRQTVSLAGSVYHKTVTKTRRFLGVDEEKFYRVNLLWSWGTVSGRSFLGVLGIWVDVTSLASIASPFIYSSTAPFNMGGIDDISLIILVSTAIWLAWCFLPCRFMTDHFALSKSNLRAGRLYTLMTAALSHQDLSHLILNSMSLASYAPNVQLLLGLKRFRVLLLTGALMGNMGSVIYNERRQYETLGGSGAIYALLGYAACHAIWSPSFPPQQVVWLGLTLSQQSALVANLALSLLVQQSGTDTAMHVSGALSGGLFYYFQLREIF